MTATKGRAPGRHGRCPLCGAIGCDEVKPIPELPKPTARTIAQHLREHHKPITQAALDAATTKDHVAWHRAEHDQRDGPADPEKRHPGHLAHTHPAPTTARKAKAA